MQVTNVKLGYATNSSSSHSIIISPYFTTLKDDVSADDFGWEYFTAHAKTSKLNYLGALLFDQLNRTLDNEILARFILKDWIEYDVDPSVSVDHQSTFSFPYSFGSDNIDKQFFDEFTDFILREDVAILGGNDNGGDCHPVLEASSSYVNISDTLPFIRGYGDRYYCRKDGDFWTLFCAGKEGVRFTFSFNDFVKPIVKYETPLLVDLKITDFCTTNCSFCYQSSTIKGKHASFESVKECLDTLSELKVFEVAIGGGNPVSHPNFVEILEYAKNKGIIANFSTRDVSFLDNKNIFTRIQNSCGNFALSVDPTTEITDLELMLEKVNSYKNFETSFMNFQVFIGPGGFTTAEQILPLVELAEKAGRTITFLGYKNIGRGKQKDGLNYGYAEFLPPLFKRLLLADRCPKIGIDTVLVKELEYSLKTLLKVNDYLFSAEEGKGSCYIDLVKQIISPSSFDNKQIKYGEMSAQNIKALFSKM